MLLSSTCHPAGPAAAIPQGTLRYRAPPGPTGLLEMTPNRTHMGSNFLLMIIELVHGRKVAGKEHPWIYTVFLQGPFSLLHLLFSGSCFLLHRVLRKHSPY